MITFYYNIDKLLDRAGVEILLLIQGIEKDGMPAFEELSAGAEDRSLLKVYLKKAALEVYAKLSPYSRDLIDVEGFEFDVTYEDEQLDNCIVIRINEPPNFDDVVRLPLDDVIENLMVNYVVGTWMKKNNQKSSHLEDYEAGHEDILRLINRRTSLRRSYKLF